MTEATGPTDGTGLTVTADEHGVVRLFALDLPDRDLLRLTDPTKLNPSPQASTAMLVGLDWLNADGFEIFDTEVLGDMSLEGYLIEGAGIRPGDLRRDRIFLNSIDGVVMILYSSAFDGAAATLKTGPGVDYIATYQEDLPPPAHHETLPAKSALLQSPPPAPVAVASTPHRTLLLALLVVPTLALLVGLATVWVF